MLMKPPPKLQKVIKRHNGKYHRIAKELGVNSGHVYKYLKQGKEPIRRDLREKMFLSKSKRKPARPRFTPEFINIWRHLNTTERHQIIKDALRKMGKLP